MYKNSMFNDKKVIVVIPVGREYHLKTLFNNLVKHKHIIDKLELWLCTQKPYDIMYIRKFQQKHPNWCEVVNLEDEEGWKFHPSNYVKYYERCIDPNTIYIKMDDDICWIDEHCIYNMCKLLTEMEGTSYKLVSANVINTSHTHLPFLKRNIIPNKKFKNFSYHENGELAMFLHTFLLKAIKTQHTNMFKAPINYPDINYVSINMICWSGSTLETMLPFGTHDESHFNYVGRSQAKADWLICGNAIASHFSYRPSFSYLSKNANLLEQYHEVSN